MSFKPRFAYHQFNKISIEDFIEKYKINNPKTDFKKLKENLLYFRKLKTAGAKCDCGNPIWVIGSAVSQKACFTCITGDSDFSNDFEIE